LDEPLKCEFVEIAAPHDPASAAILPMQAICARLPGRLIIS
jgi:hypothetical protein